MKKILFVILIKPVYLFKNTEFEISYDYRTLISFIALPSSFKFKTKLFLIFLSFEKSLKYLNKRKSFISIRYKILFTHNVIFLHAFNVQKIHYYQ